MLDSGLEFKKSCLTQHPTRLFLHQVTGQISKLKWCWKQNLKAQHLTVQSCSKFSFLLMSKSACFFSSSLNGQGLVSQNSGCARLLGMTSWPARNHLVWPGLWLWSDWFRISYIGSSMIILFLFLLCAMWNLSKCLVPTHLARKWGVQRSTSVTLLAYIKTS